MAIPPKLDRRCALFEGIRQASIGTEPADIERAGEALRRVALRHPTLAELEARLRRARRIKAPPVQIVGLPDGVLGFLSARRAEEPDRMYPDAKERE